MDTNPTPTSTIEYQQVTVDVPEDRVAEFHAFFARFLAGTPGRGRRGRHGRPHRGSHRRHCAERRDATEHGEATERGEATGQPADISEV